MQDSGRIGSRWHSTSAHSGLTLKQSPLLFIRTQLQYSIILILKISKTEPVTSAIGSNLLRCSGESHALLVSLKLPPINLLMVKMGKNAIFCTFPSPTTPHYNQILLTTYHARCMRFIRQSKLGKQLV